MDPRAVAAAADQVPAALEVEVAVALAPVAGLVAGAAVLVALGAGALP